MHHRHNNNEHYVAITSHNSTINSMRFKKWPRKTRILRIKVNELNEYWQNLDVKIILMKES